MNNNFNSTLNEKYQIKTYFIDLPLYLLTQHSNQSFLCIVNTFKLLQTRQTFDGESINKCLWIYKLCTLSEY